MAEKTQIQWTDHTFNPWIGCTKVSAGCLHCYAEKATPSRVFNVGWGKGEPRKLTSESNWKKPIAWNNAAKKSGDRRKVFCASLADWLDDEVPIGWLAKLLILISHTPYLDWQLLTKRPENWRSRIGAAIGVFHCHFDSDEASTMCADWLDGEPPKNAWFGVTVENQEMCDRRFPVLKEVPAHVHFLSMEPLLGPVVLPDQYYEDVDWIIVGGESGPNARPCDVKWIDNIMDREILFPECMECSFIFVKQLGSNPIGLGVIEDSKGGNIDEFPKRLQTRQFPNYR